MDVIVFFHGRDGECVLGIELSGERWSACVFVLLCVCAVGVCL